MNNEIVELALAELNPVIVCEIEVSKENKNLQQIINKSLFESKVGSKSNFISYECKINKKQINIEGFSKGIIELYKNDNDYEYDKRISFLRYFLDLVCEEKEKKFFKNENIDEKLREYAKIFILELVNSYSTNKIKSFYKDINIIAELNYEKKHVNGKILLLKDKKIEKHIEYMFKLPKGIKNTDVKMIRKLLEITNNENYLISNGDEVLGIGRITKIESIKNREMMVVTFIGKGHYKLSYIHVEAKGCVEKYIVSIKNGIPKLIETDYSEVKLSNIYQDIFGEKIDSNIEKIIKKATTQSKGTMIVLTDSAESQMEELSSYGMKIKKRKIQTEDILNITAIDGAIMLDDKGDCYGIGVILDGIAKGAQGNPERGARYNSAIKYVAKCKNEEIEIKVMIIVVSEDGMIDILPDRIEIEKDINKRLLECRQNFKINEYREVIENCKNILNINNKIEEAYFYMALSKDNLKDYQGALLDYQGALKLNSKNTSTYFNKGIIKIQLGHYLEALLEFDEIIKLDPNDKGAYYSKGHVQSLLGNNEEAILNYSEALKLEKDKNIYYDRGFEKAILGNNEEAILDFNEALKLDPNFSAVYNNRGNSKVAIGDGKGAILDFNKYIKLNPKSFLGYLNRAFAKIELIDYQGAISDFTNAKRLDPNNDTYDELIKEYNTKLN